VITVAAGLAGTTTEHKGVSVYSQNNGMTMMMGGGGGGAS